jgi:putative phosphoribosyl transferase
MRLRAAGLATLVFDLLTESDAADWGPVCDMKLLAGRLLAGIEWAAAQPEVEGLSIGLYGAGIGAAAALLAAAEEPETVAAVVCRGGRPDLAGDALARVKAPTLLLVGSWDEPGLELNRAALARLTCHKELEVIPGATQLFDEPGALDNVARWSAPWFVRYLMLERTWGEAGGCEGSCSCRV